MSLHRNVFNSHWTHHTQNTRNTHNTHKTQHTHTKEQKQKKAKRIQNDRQQMSQNVCNFWANFMTTTVPPRKNHKVWPKIFRQRAVWGMRCHTMLIPARSYPTPASASYNIIKAKRREPSQMQNCGWKLLGTACPKIAPSCPNLNNTSLNEPL